MATTHIPTLEYAHIITSYFTFHTAQGLSTAEAVGITIVLSSIVSFSAGLLVALAIAYCYIRQLNSKGQYSPRDPQQPAPMYEDISMVTGKDFEMKENIAYGPVGHQ